MSEPAPFLSVAWRAELASRLSNQVIGKAGGPRCALGQVVRDGDNGDVAYTITFGAGLPTTLEDGVDAAVVTITEDRETAEALYAGASPNDVLFEGQIKVSGDLNALLAAGDDLADLMKAIGEAS